MLALLQGLDLGEGTALGASPLITLTLGVVLLLVAEVLPSLARHKHLIFIGTLISTAWCELILLRRPLDLPIFQGTYLADPARALWGLVFLASAGVAWAFSRRYYRSSRAFLGEHDVLLLVTPIGMHLMAGAQDLIVFFIGLELLSVPLYCLAAFRRRRDASVEAGLKYFLLGAFAAATFLYGAALVYTGSGTLSIVELKNAAAGEAAPLVTVGAALLAASVFFKVGLTEFSTS
jgi:NADH-quinone oxidoreductase subunit N